MKFILPLTTVLVIVVSSTICQAQYNQNLQLKLDVKPPSLGKSNLIIPITPKLKINNPIRAVAVYRSGANSNSNSASSNSVRYSTPSAHGSIPKHHSNQNNTSPTSSSPASYEQNQHLQPSERKTEKIAADLDLVNKRDASSNSNQIGVFGWVMISFIAMVVLGAIGSCLE